VLYTFNICNLYRYRGIRIRNQFANLNVFTTAYRLSARCLTEIIEYVNSDAADWLNNTPVILLLDWETPDEDRN
jgi:hypothetical protein